MVKALLQDEWQLQLVVAVMDNLKQSMDNVRQWRDYTW